MQDNKTKIDEIIHKITVDGKQRIKKRILKEVLKDLAPFFNLVLPNIDQQTKIIKSCRVLLCASLGLLHKYSLK